ncbi:MAG: GAF domain-containing protein [Flavobacteriales bacterium]|nr:GAF domain-containing protein [Flavobacteriales bacterium]
MSDKTSKYRGLVPEIKALIDREAGLIANLANISAALAEEFSFLWVGFYLVQDNELIVGPFQGPVACTRIARGRGVCGVAWDKGEVVIVENVHEFSGHIACSAESNSEIVLPISDRHSVVQLVLDIDSEMLGAFDEIDAQYLGQIVKEIETLL